MDTIQSTSKRKPRRRPASVATTATSAQSYKDNGNVAMGFGPRTRKLSARLSRHFRKTETESTLAPSPSRSLSPWSTFGRLFQQRWPSIRKKFSRQSSRSTSDSGVELCQENTDSSARSENPSEVNTSLPEQLADSKRNERVPHYKVVSRETGTRTYAVALDTGSSTEVCKEYISRLKCYDALPHWAELIAIDSAMPLEKVFHILRLSQRATRAIVWDSAKGETRGVCDLRQLMDSFWRKGEVGKEITRPLADFLDNNARFWGLSTEAKLSEAAQLLCELGPMTRYSCDAIGSLVLPIFDENTADIVNALSAMDVLYFLSRQICKFHLTALFDQVLISDLHPDSFDSQFLAELQISLEPTATISEAISRLLASECGALAVMKMESLGSVPKFDTVVSITDIVDFVLRQRGRWTEKVLGKCLREMLVKMPKKTILTFEIGTSLATVLKVLAASNAPTDPLDPISIIVNDEGDFTGFLLVQDVLRAVLSLNSGRNSIQRRDSGVGDDLVLESSSGSVCA